MPKGIELIIDINSDTTVTKEIEIDDIPKDTPNKALLERIRAKRNQLLSECDWTQFNDSPLSSAQKELWAKYRQELRDFPETCDINNPAFPTKPI